MTHSFRLYAIFSLLLGSLVASVLLVMNRKPSSACEDYDIAFTGHGWMGKTTPLYLIDSKSGKQRNPIHDVWFNARINGGMQWSPDRQKIAFTSVESNPNLEESIPAVFIADISTGKTEKLLDSGATSFLPRWSPDGKEIAVIGSLEGSILNLGLLRVNLETGNVKQLVEDSYIFRGSPERFVWSDNGKSIFYTKGTSRYPREGTDRVSEAGIIKLDLRTFTEELLYEGPEESVVSGQKYVTPGTTYLDIKSPLHILENQNLLFILQTKSSQKKEVIELDLNDLSQTKILDYESADRRKLKSPEAHFHIYELSLSPDQKEIAYISSVSGRTEVYVANSDGSGRRQITNDKKFKLAVTWSCDASKVVYAQAYSSNLETKPSSITMSELQKYRPSSRLMAVDLETGNTEELSRNLSYPNFALMGGSLELDFPFLAPSP